MNERAIRERARELFKMLDQGRVTDSILVLRSMGDALEASAVVAMLCVDLLEREDLEDDRLNRLLYALELSIQRDAYVHKVEVLVLAGWLEEFNRYRDTMLKTFENLAVDMEEVDEWCVAGSAFEGEMVIPVTFRSDSEELVEKVADLVCAAFDWALYPDGEE